MPYVPVCPAGAFSTISNIHGCFSTFVSIRPIRYLTEELNMSVTNAIYGDIGVLLASARIMVLSMM